MSNNFDFDKAIELIENDKHILITTHRRPDGDACGCIAAMCEMLGNLGKKVTPLLLSAVPPWYKFLFVEKVPILDEDVQLNELTTGKLGDFDLIVIVDTNSTSQLPQFDEFLKRNDKPVLVIDHHATADGLGDVELVDSTAAAAGLIVLELFKHAGWKITETIAEALFVAIATDTGWFQFSNTDSRTYRAGAELIEAGAKPTSIYETLYQNYSPARFRLRTRMLDTLELHLGDRYADMRITQKDFERTDAQYSDTENLINEAHRIGTVTTSALFIELKDGRIRCSLRSRGSVDVSQIAAKFGGGGHKQAAGTFLPGPIENARKLILDEITEALS
jgi:phosphoesterase RecJ-like protein